VLKRLLAHYEGVGPGAKLIADLGTLLLTEG
jgi:hypothetical protein